MNGYGERCGNANLVTILADLQLKLGFDVRAAGAARAPDRDRPPGRRAVQRRAEPQPALRGRQRVRAQGRDARGRREPRLAHVRAHRPGRGGRRPAGADLRAVGQGHGAGAGRRDRRRAGRRGRGPGGERVKDLETAATSWRPPTARSTCSSAARPATTSRCSGWSRGAASSRSARTARSRPRPRSRSGWTASASCAPPRATARCTRWTTPCATPSARPTRTCATSSWSTSRSASWTRPRAPARSRACCWTPATATTPGARSACRRTSSRPAGRRWSTRSRRACCPGASTTAPSRGRPVSDEPIPLARPGHRRARGGAGGRRRCDSGRCWRSGPRVAEFEAGAGPRAGRRARVGRLQRHRGAAPGGPRLGHRARATRWSPRPFSFVASANCVLYEGAEPVFCDIDPRTLNIDPAAAAAAVTDAHHGPAARAHLRLPGRHARLRAPGRPSAACGSSRTRARRSAPCTPTARRWARAATSPRSASTPTSSWPRGRGARWSAPTRRSRRAWTASATRAARPTWAGSTTTGWASTTGCPTWPARSGLAQLERLDADAGRPRAGGGPLRRRRWPGSRGWSCPAPTPAATAAAGSSTWCSCPRGVDRDATVTRAARAGHRLQALPAGDPPDELLPRALRPPRGRVPGVRGRGRALAGAAVLPGADRGPGRSGSPRPWPRLPAAQLLEQRHAARQRAAWPGCRPPPRSRRPRTARGPACCPCQVSSATARRPVRGGPAARPRRAARGPRRGGGVRSAVARESM